MKQNGRQIKSPSYQSCMKGFLSENRGYSIIYFLFQITLYFCSKKYSFSFLLIAKHLFARIAGPNMFSIQMP